MQKISNKAQLGDQMYLIYFIFIMIIITVGIVAGSYSAFGKSYDSRKSDSEILLTHITECLESNNPLSDIKIKNVLVTCDIEPDTLQKGMILYIYSGNTSYFKFGDHVICGLQDKYPNGPKCSYGSIRNNINNIVTDVNIIAGSNVR